MPEYIMVEIIGILWDNMVDYLIQIEDKRLYICIREKQNNIHIVMRNPIRGISYEEITMFFEKNYSQKENHSGLGLSKLQSYAEKYRLQLSAEKIFYDEVEWLSIAIDMM